MDQRGGLRQPDLCAIRCRAKLFDRAFEKVMMRAAGNQVEQRTAAMAIGVEKARDAKQVRGLFP
jgi:glutamate dehydrogenase (NAD(P)+)